MEEELLLEAESTLSTFEEELPRKHENTKFCSSGRKPLWHYSLLLVSTVGYIFTVSFSQAVGPTSTILIVLGCRTVLAIIFSLLYTVIAKQPYAIERKDWYKVALFGILNYIDIGLFCAAATYLPIGNTDAIEMGLVMVFTSCVDLIRKQIPKAFIGVTVTAVIGLILLVQPLHVGQNVLTCLCEYIDRTFPSENSYSLSNSSDLEMTGNSESDSNNSLLIGYTLLFLSGLTACAGDNFGRLVLVKYPINAFLLWQGIVKMVFVAFIVAGLGIFHPSSLKFASEGACLYFTLAFIVALTLLQISISLTLKYFPVSMLYSVAVMSLIALYVLQRTLPNLFNPGHANALEVCGIVCILLSSIASPIVHHYFSETKKPKPN